MVLPRVLRARRNILARELLLPHQSNVAADSNRVRERRSGKTRWSGV